MCEEQTERRKESKDRKKEEEHPCVCSFWRLSLHLHPPQSVLWQAHALKKKNRLGGRGLLLERKYRLEREGEGGRQRNRGREQVSEILPFICLSFTPLCSLVVWRGDWFSDACVPPLIGTSQSRGKQEVGRQKKAEKDSIKGKVEPRLIDRFFTPSLFYLSRRALLFFAFFSQSKR